MGLISRFSIFKKPEHRKFDPIPRFYNPEKEYLEDRLAKVHKKEDEKYANIRSNIRRNFRDNRAGFGMSKHKIGRGRSSNLRLIVILILIIIITYYLLTKYFVSIESLIK